MIELSPSHPVTVQSILAEHVPGCEVRAFGSRAPWTASNHSDLDLAVVGEGPLDRGTTADLKEAFEESNCRCVWMCWIGTGCPWNSGR